ncbi:MAG: GTP-binding protein [Planctomycetes bacterium]|nr:GTP-binding protein [Planctomycetota bacterium]
MNRIAVTILTGFLGSGKTSLVNRILREDHGRRVAVLVNELGEIGLDGALLDGEGAFVELDNGCICCALSEDLPVTLDEMARRGDLDQVVIETTGVADPGPVALAIGRPEIADRFRLDAVIATADVINLEQSLAEHVEALAQIRRADLVVLTKCDLVDEGVIAAARARVAIENGRARILRGDEAAVGSVVLAPEVDRPFVQPLFSAMPRGHDFKSVALRLGTRGTIRLAFEEFLAELPSGVWRGKGIVPIEGERGRLVFHVVGSRRELHHDPHRDDEGALVFIGKDFDEEMLREELDCLFAAL